MLRRADLIGCRAWGSNHPCRRRCPALVQHGRSAGRRAHHPQDEDTPNDMKPESET